jgi:hypothetical protein
MTGRTASETADHMIERYGRDAEIHCVFARMNNERTPAGAFWKEVQRLIIEKRKARR